MPIPRPWRNPLAAGRLLLLPTFADSTRRHRGPPQRLRPFPLHLAALSPVWFPPISLPLFPFSKNPGCPRHPHSTGKISPHVRQFTPA